MNASRAASSSRNDHSLALVSLETWEYNSPWVKVSGKNTDVGLLAMALVYYDQVLVELQHPQQLRDIVEWAVRTGHIGQLIGLIKEGTLRFHHHAFMTSAVNIDGVFSIWNLQEAT